MLRAFAALKTILESCPADLSANELKAMLPFYPLIKWYEAEFSIDELERVAQSFEIAKR
jgi:hypothetical protein